MPVADSRQHAAESRAHLALWLHVYQPQGDEVLTDQFFALFPDHLTQRGIRRADDALRIERQQPVRSALHKGENSAIGALPLARDCNQQDSNDADL